MKIKTQTLLTAALLLASSFATAGLYRWVDDKGEVHFSDKVPVAASKKAHTKLDKSGSSQKELDPAAKIAKKVELDLLALEKAEEEKINKIVRDKRAEKRKRDQFLLSTYENKGEIVTSFETKIKMLKGNTAILSAHNERLKKKVNTLKSKPKNKENELKIVNISQTIEQYKEALEGNDIELLSLKTNYKINLRRYSELTQ